VFVRGVEEAEWDEDCEVVVSPTAGGEEVGEVLLNPPVMQADEITITVIMKTMASEVPLLIFSPSIVGRQFQKPSGENIER
jgi:hypothetical protein